jgi:hypothetical protein
MSPPEFQLPALAYRDALAVAVPPRMTVDWIPMAWLLQLVTALPEIVWEVTVWVWLTV